MVSKNLGKLWYVLPTVIISLDYNKVLNSDLPLFQLLSEIAEVEESRDDNISPRNKKGPNSASHDDPSLEPRVKRPVTRSNKRRSLSLPTGIIFSYFLSRHEKTCLSGFRPGPTKTGLYYDSYRKMA